MVHDANPEPETGAVSTEYDLAHQLMRETIEAARLAYPDFDALRPMIDIMAGVFRSECIDWTRIRPAEYVEMLYVAVKHCSFAAEARDDLLERSRIEAPAATPLVQ
jgi:hypothetical protein